MLIMGTLKAAARHVAGVWPQKLDAVVFIAVLQVLFVLLLDDLLH